MTSLEQSSTRLSEASIGRKLSPTTGTPRPKVICTPPRAMEGLRLTSENPSALKAWYLIFETVLGLSSSKPSATMASARTRRCSYEKR